MIIIILIIMANGSTAAADDNDMGVGNANGYNRWGDKRQP